MRSPERATRRFDAVVLAGGEGRRLGGTDKASLTVGDTTLLDTVLAAVADADQIVCVGPPRTTSATVTWTREEPPGGGPVAGLSAGLAGVRAPLTVVLAVDLPFVSRSVVRRLVEEWPPGGSVLVADEGGRTQPFLGVYDTIALRERLRTLGNPAGAPMRDVLEGLTYTVLHLPAVAFDCDTWKDVEHARRAQGGV